MLRADLAQSLQVPLGRHQHAGRARHRLDDHGGDVARVVQRDDALEVVGEVRAPRGLAARVGVVREVVRVRQVVHARQLRAEELAVVDHAAHGDAAEAHAVVAALAADEARARALAAHAVVGERDLERGVHRLRARVGEEHVVEARPAASARSRWRARTRPGAPSGRAARIPSRAIWRPTASAISRAAVARVHAPQPRDAVEDLPALRRPVVHAGGAARAGAASP